MTLTRPRAADWLESYEKNGRGDKTKLNNNHEIRLHNTVGRENLFNAHKATSGKVVALLVLRLFHNNWMKTVRMKLADEFYIQFGTNCEEEFKMLR